MRSLTTRTLRPLIQVSGLVRKEVSQTLRQPQLLLLLVAGPFVILVMFGFGYDEDHLALRTVFVGPPDSIYETAVGEHSEMLSDYVVPAGYSSDVFAARQRLEQGEVDLIVVFPDDAQERLIEGERAPITILHDKLDPIQLIAVEIASRLAVAEVNATILEALVEEGLEGMRPLSSQLDMAVNAAQELERAADAGDAAEFAERRAELDRALGGAETALIASATVARELGVDVGDEADDLDEALDAVLSDLRSLRTTVVAADVEDGVEVAEATARMAEDAATLVNVPPEVVVRPFDSVVNQLSRHVVTSTSYFAPSTIALLLTHLGVTFTAMSVIADRRLGVFETYRVAPIGWVQVVGSKYLAYLSLGALVGAALLAAVVLLLGVPMAGQVAWVAVAVIGMVLASIGLGLIVAAFARTDSQAVQYSMLLLLASLFFGGFFLEVDAFAAPVQVLSQVLPVTYGISLFQDVMLRGIDPQPLDLAKLGALIVAFGAAAVLLTRRQLRT